MASHEYPNITSEFENDPFEENNADYGIAESYIWYLIIVSIIGFLLALVVLSADIFLIYVICKFERLKSRTNMYILNCAILNILYIISRPLFYILGGMIHYVNYYDCYEVHAMNVFLALYIVFAFALALDWFLSGYTPTLMEKYNRFYKYVFIVLYVVFLVDGSIAVTVCYTSHVLSRYYITIVLYIIGLILVVVLNILAKQVTLRNGSSKTAYSLTVTNIIIFSYLPLLIYHVLFDTLPIGHMIMPFMEFIPVYIALVHPILVVYMLGKQNKYFKMAYQRSFNKRSIRSYGDENLDEGSDAETDIGNARYTVNHLNENKPELKLAIDN